MSFRLTLISIFYSEMQFIEIGHEYGLWHCCGQEDLAMPISSQEIAEFHRDGAVCIRGLLRGWEDVIAAGIERNIREPGPYATDYSSGQQGSFFDDYCNWTRIP